MIPMNGGSIQPGHCYTLGNSGFPTHEEPRASAVFFAKPGLMHVVMAVDSGLNIMINEWKQDINELKILIPYQDRLILWAGRVWLIMSVTEQAIYSLVVRADECEYILTTVMYETESDSGGKERFPFATSTFRTFRRQQRQIENK